MNVFLFSALSILSITTSAMADGKIEIRVDEKTIQKSIDKLWAGGQIPTKFGKSSSTEDTVELTCLAPMVRFPKAIYGESMNPELILHYVCAAKSAKYAFEIACPYSKREQVPASEWDARSEKKCPHIQVALTPAVEKASDGSQSVVFRKLRIQRLALFPAAFSSEIAEKFVPIEKRFLEELNANFELLGNPWFRTLSPLPVKLKNWRHDFQKAGQPVKTTIEVEADKIILDSNAAELVIRAKFIVRTGGGS